MKSVLVIDDDPAMRDFIRLYLEKGGYKVAEADNGKQGMKLFGQLPIDLVIIDIFMPEMDGIETIGEMKSSKQDCKLMAISGGGTMGNLDYLKHAKAFGAHASLTKPFSGDELLGEVKKLIGQA